VRLLRQFQSGYVFNSARILLVQDGCREAGHGAFAPGQPFGHAKRLVNPDDLLQIALGIVAKCGTHVLSSPAHRLLSFVSLRANHSKSRGMERRARPPQVRRQIQYFYASFI